jgi:hypothetical protein
VAIPWDGSNESFAMMNVDHDNFGDAYVCAYG